MKWLQDLRKGNNLKIITGDNVRAAALPNFEGRIRPRGYSYLISFFPIGMRNGGAFV